MSVRTTQRRLAAAMTALALCSVAGADQPAAATPDWRSAERPMLRNHVQLTFPDRFTRAGEAYFSPDSSWIIFQATPVPAADDEEPSPHYAMYVAKLKRDDQRRITGVQPPIRLSEPGSANTCGFFHPQHPHRVIFGSTVKVPSGDARAGYQRESRDYSWLFPDEMEVVTRSVIAIWEDLLPKDEPRPQVMWGEDARTGVPLWRQPGYTAECAYSPDGRFIIYTNVDPETGHPNIKVFDTTTETHTPLVMEEGYDGGPFFSPCGTRICYRSDREGNNLLQLFVADLAFDENGAITGIEREHQLTADRNVNWAPFWHPSGEFLVFATSRVSHHQYEVYSIEVPPRGVGPIDRDSLRSRRITHSTGFDGLPVFNNDGDLMMWTSQRGEKLEHEQRPSSQVWLAEVVSVRP